VKNMEDNWKHRADNMRCKTCMWFVPKSIDVIASKEIYLGRCRRHSPKIEGYPAVFSMDWCGDHKIDEDKM